MIAACSNSARMKTDKLACAGRRQGVAAGEGEISARDCQAQVRGGAEGGESREGQAEGCQGGVLASAWVATLMASRQSASSAVKVSPAEAGSACQLPEPVATVLAGKGRQGPQRPRIAAGGHAAGVGVAADVGGGGQ